MSLVVVPQTSGWLAANERAGPAPGMGAERAVLG